MKISEFIEKTLLLYGGYVSSEHNQNYLPNIVISTMKAIMRDSENRHNRNRNRNSRRCYNGDSCNLRNSRASYARVAYPERMRIYNKNKSFALDESKEV